MDGNSILSNCDFSLLPPHVIAHIFKYLDFDRLLICTRTCKSWYYASCDPIIWQNIAVRIDDDTIQNQFEQFHRPIGVLRLENINFDTFYNYKEFFAKFGQFIREIDFCYSTLTLQQLFDCLICLSNLISLTLRFSGPIFTSEINLSNSDKQIIRTNLNSVRDCFIPSDVPFKGPLHYIISCMPNIKSLRFGAFGFNKAVPNYYTFFEYVNMFAQEVNLDYLNLVFPITDVLKFMARFSKITQKLNISKVEFFPPICTEFGEYYHENFVIFCKKLSNVRSLTISLPGENHLVDICRYMTNLTELCLDMLSHHENISSVGYLQHLEKLTLLFQSLFTFRPSDVLSEDVLLELLPKLGSLKELCIYDHPITQRGIEVLCLSCKKLTRLDLTGLVTNNFEFIFKHLTNLEYLKLKFYHWRFQDVHLDHECDITNLRKLKQLTITEFAPGMTRNLIMKQLPNFKLCSD